MEKRYRALRAIARIFKILGWVILALGILSACGISGAFLLRAPSVPGMMGANVTGGEAGLLWGLIGAAIAFVGMIVTVGLYALILIAGSEAINVFLDIEVNTREIARRLG
ncbi:MAG: hypothetical protein GTN93_32725 [Anaerolineae bacterium]|nr:hypothetical protein [Anaerolineae bacterium]NIQ82757.1 hypothetical protein [Anaerolineae bacterium]